MFSSFKSFSTKPVWTHSPFLSWRNIGAHPILGIFLPRKPKTEIRRKFPLICLIFKSFDRYLRPVSLIRWKPRKRALSRFRTMRSLLLTFNFSRISYSNKLSTFPFISYHVIPTFLRILLDEMVKMSRSISTQWLKSPFEMLKTFRLLFLQFRIQMFLFFARTIRAFKLGKRTSQQIEEPFQREPNNPFVHVGPQAEERKSRNTMVNYRRRVNSINICA